ncbi:hypothetical protein CEXT_175981 [Caerostris extrusa]|uniref:Uncharacterized protein n=1 Tax=Caerostris extrusa TaxID=172846 RepID=A0AAV4NLK9_CAEEX|nr:hypothetical protein CEXT_175981 [Caerostris extrusa]
MPADQFASGQWTSFATPDNSGGTRYHPLSSSLVHSSEDRWATRFIASAIPRRSSRVKPSTSAYRRRYHDGWPDCDDGSDEECSRGQHRCRCGLPHCVDIHKVKDGVKDCEDGSDEDDKKNSTKRCPTKVDSKISWQ